MTRTLISMPVLLIAGYLAIPCAAQTDGASPADFAAYHEALSAPSDRVALPVTFRDLWEQPERYRGQRVRVQGTVERRFRQPGQGLFPALTELWILDDAGNPYCLVFPTHPGAGAPGAAIPFEGRFLRLIRYQGADAERVAPLIVGPDPPGVVETVDAVERRALPDVGNLEIWIAGLLAVAVVLILGVQHTRKRPAIRATWATRAPEFVEPETPAHDHGDNNATNPYPSERKPPGELPDGP